MSNWSSPSLSLFQARSLHTMITWSPHHPCMIISQLRWSSYDLHTMTIWSYDPHTMTGLTASPPPRPASGAQLASTSTGAASAKTKSCAPIGRTSPSSSPIGWQVEEEEALVVKGQKHPPSRLPLFDGSLLQFRENCVFSSHQQPDVDHHLTIRLNKVM